MWHQHRAARHLDPNHIGPGFGRMTDNDRQPRPWRKRREWLPIDIFGQYCLEFGLIRLVFAGHEVSPFLSAIRDH